MSLGLSVSCRCRSVVVRVYPFRPLSVLVRRVRWLPRRSCLTLLTSCCRSVESEVTNVLVPLGDRRWQTPVSLCMVPAPLSLTCKARRQQCLVVGQLPCVTVILFSFSIVQSLAPLIPCVRRNRCLVWLGPPVPSVVLFRRTVS